MRLLLFAFAGVVASAAPVTFYKDALPVLQRNCQTCHRPGEAAPMSFLTYETTRPWAKSIKNAVLTHKMPPWFADPHYGKFANDRSLSEADLNTLVAWVDSGAEAGDPEDAPKPVEWTEGWTIGKPDVVYQIPTLVEIPASGTIDYQYVIVPTGFAEDRYVQLSEARPTDRARTHHIIAFIRPPGSRWFKDAPAGVPFVPDHDKRASIPGEFLAGYAPGMVAQMLKPNQAKLVKAGSDIVFQLHYTANGKPGSDQSRVGMIFSKEKPAERVVTLAAANEGFAIPPGDPNYRVDSKITLQDESTLIALLPHMHLRGKSFEYRLAYPNGEKETILSVPHYSFSWQLSYYLDQPRPLPAGTIIECTAYFDNSANNPANPDPSKEITFGEQSWDEMMIGFFDVAIPIDRSPADLFRQKRTKKESGAGQ